MSNLYKFFIVLGFFIILPSYYLFAQVAINTDNTPPNTSAMLDVKSANKGLLPPRMTHAQMNTIVNPANGLIIYCTDCSNSGIGALAMFINNVWQIFNPSCLVPLFPESGIHSPEATQITWNWSTVADATGYKWSTANNYAGSTDLGTATTKTEMGLSCNTPYTRYAWAYNACGNSTPVTLDQTTSVCSFTCGSPITINHVAGVVAPVSKTTTYGSVTNIPGEITKCWITSNLGADQQATAISDATEASAGWYWQFNRKQGYKHDGTTRTPGTLWIISISENLDWQTANDPCALELGSGWRIPTNTEWTNVDAIGGWTNWNGPWNSLLKLHSAGDLFINDATLRYRGLHGIYWSNTQYNITIGWSIGFDVHGCGMYNNTDSGKAWGFSLRCIRD